MNFGAGITGKTGTWKTSMATGFIWIPMRQSGWDLRRNKTKTDKNEAAENIPIQIYKSLLLCATHSCNRHLHLQNARKLFIIILEAIKGYFACPMTATGNFINKVYKLHRLSPVAVEDSHLTSYGGYR